MTIVLHLGCVDVPYVNDDAHTRPPPVRKAKRGGSKWRREDLIGGDSITTTGQVAELLEERYHIMRHFVELHEEELTEFIGNSLAGAFETAQSRRMSPGEQLFADPFASAKSDIETAFKNFLNNREMDALGYPGIPTKAAKAGVNPRLMHPYSKKNHERPSFIRTGLYQSSFTAWMEWT